MKILLILLLSLSVLACPNPDIVKEYYVAEEPVVTIQGAIFTMECLGSSTAPSETYSTTEFIDSVLKNNAHCIVDTAHGKHDKTIGYTFTPNISKITAKHQHGRQTISFRVADSTGVFELSSIDIFITHDTIAPVVSYTAGDMGIIPFGIAVTDQYLIEQILSLEGFNVVLNNCAKAESQKYEFIDFDYGSNFVENTSYSVKFKVKDSLGHTSEEESVTFTYGENLTGIPTATQLKDIDLTCSTITAGQILAKVNNVEYVTVDVKPGNSLLPLKIISGLEGIVNDTHYHNDNLQVIVEFKDTENLVSQKAIKVFVGAKDPVPPVLPAGVDNTLLATFLKSKKVFSQEKLIQILTIMLNEKIVHDPTVVPSSCASTTNVSMTDIVTVLDMNIVGEYAVVFKIVDETGTKSATTYTVKVKVVKESTLPDGIRATVTVEGKELFLTHYDDFTSMETLETNWDIGNPGYGYDGAGRGVDYTQYRIDSGNAGVPKPTLVEFPDGIKGYSGDRYKQAYWSPKAVDINAQGELEIQVYWDDSIVTSNTDGYVGGGGSLNITGEGYGLTGAIHSKRQFPSGLFVTKIRHKTGKRNTHWDAVWGESNNPFSRDYGIKELFMPVGGAGRSRVGNRFDYTVRADVEDRGINGEMVYEWDLYEWMNVDDAQWRVFHVFDWSRGYTGNEDRPDGGEQRLWVGNFDLFTRGNREEMNGLNSVQFSDGGLARDGTWFYLVMLNTPTKIKMWTVRVDESIVQEHTVRHSVSAVGAFGNSGQPNMWSADDHNPLQFKFSSELGNWNNYHKGTYDQYLAGNMGSDDKDVMYAEYFAFYAWDTTGTYPVIE